MEGQHIDLASIFGAVTQSLAENQQTLDQADEYNKNHGSNMVQTFKTITDALEKQKGKSDGAALSYAAKTLAKTANSSSSKQYAENLTRAATQFKDTPVDSRGAFQLLQTLIGAGQASAPAADQGGGDALSSLLGGLVGGGGTSQGSSAQGGDPLSALLGGLAGGGASQGSTTQGGDALSALLGGLAGGGGTSQGSSAQGGDALSSLLGGLAGGGSQGSSAQGGDALSALLGGLAGGGGSQGSSAQGGDALSALLGGLAGGGASQGGSAQGGDALSSLLGGLAGGGGSSSGTQQQGGLDMASLLSAGMAYMQAKQSGANNTQAAIQAFLALSGMGNSRHRTQSTGLVVQSFLEALSGQS